MITPINDGGPAFPVASKMEKVGEVVTVTVHQGMSLRDWFAGLALQGLCACPNVEWPADEIALYAYKHADAMFVAREQKGTP